MSDIDPRVERDIRGFRDDWTDRDQAKATLRTYDRHLRKFFTRYTTLCPETALTDAREHLRSFDSRH